MSSAFVFGEQDAVPGGPLQGLVPPDEDEVTEVLPGAEHRLARPDVLRQVLDVLQLQVKTSWKQNILLYT